MGRGLIRAGKSVSEISGGFAVGVTLLGTFRFGWWYRMQRVRFLLISATPENRLSLSYVKLEIIVRR